MHDPQGVSCRNRAALETLEAMEIRPAFRFYRRLFCFGQIVGARAGIVSQALLKTRRCVGSSARCGLPLARVGREDRSREGFNANSPRRVGPPRAGRFGLAARVDPTEARNFW
jgi:hypothetical protein